MFYAKGLPYLPAGARTAVPDTVADTATLPKFISTVLAIEIGVMMVAEAEAVAVAWAKDTLVPAMMIAAVTIALVKFFILSYFSLFEFDCLNSI